MNFTTVEWFYDGWYFMLRESMASCYIYKSYLKTGQICIPQGNSDTNGILDKRFTHIQNTLPKSEWSRPA